MELACVQHALPEPGCKILQDSWHEGLLHSEHEFKGRVEFLFQTRARSCMERIASSRHPEFVEDTRGGIKSVAACLLPDRSRGHRHINFGALHMLPSAGYYLSRYSIKSDLLGS